MLLQDITPRVSVVHSRSKRNKRARAKQPSARPLVMTKSPPAASLQNDFLRRLTALKKLRNAARDAYADACAALLTFAVEYAALYADVQRNGELVRTLNASLDLDDCAATRLRTIATHVPRLNAIQKHLPASLEPLYELTLALKSDEAVVRKAIDDGILTPESTLRDIRALRKPVNMSILIQSGREVRGGRDFRPISRSLLQNVEFSFVFPLPDVPRSRDVDNLRDELLGVLAKYGVRYGGLTFDGRLQADSTLRWYLDAYWKLKDQADALHREVEAEATAFISSQTFSSDDERRNALDTARTNVWDRVKDRRVQLEEQFTKMFCQRISPAAARA